MKKLILIIAVAIAAYAGFTHTPGTFPIPSIESFFPSSDSGLSTSDEALQDAFENKHSDFQVGGSGTVVKILPDDNQGRRHQRFIIELASQQTLLIAHNIDLAPRVASLEVGDHVNFYGEYEWNAKGGVIHWTHHDPAGRHADGWLNHGGKLYQ